MAKKAAQKKGEGPMRLVVLDSHAIIHRAYHALPDFSTSKNVPTGALYGLVSTLLKIIEVFKPDYIVAARDLPGATHRHELFEEYKATRVELDPNLIPQLQYAPKIFKAFGIPLYEKAGYEADDVIGTIVHDVASRSDLEVVIGSGDMDMLQLVSPSVRVYTMRTGLNDLVLYDEDRVKERYGFGPKLVVDFKGIRGDSSDNISGVKGVGEGTASKLIGLYGGLDAIYKVIKKEGVEQVAKEAGVQKRYVQLVADHKKEAEFSKSLATIHPNVPLSFELPKHRWNLSEHAPAISALCDELEFKSLKERMQRYAGKAPAPEAQKAVQEIDPRALRETSVALWLINSDISNPSLEDILHFGGSDDFEEARTAIFQTLHKTGKLRKVYDEIEHPLIPIVERMNQDGVYIDTARLKELAKEYSKELGKLAGKIYAHAGHEFNISSPKQLGVVLYDELKITPEKQKMTSTGARTTKESELQKVSDAHPIIQDVLAYRELQKLLSTYIEKLPDLVGKDGRLHAEFLQAGTTTGRMSSQNPNLQNIPIKTELGRRIRTAFAAPKGRVLASLDYSQIELRIAAGLSGDKKLVDVFKKGGDIHAAVASEVFDVPPDMVDYEMRRRAKVINFGILYGMGVNALRANLGAGISREEAAKFLSDYFKNFSGLAHYIERTKSDAAKHGYTETLFGRRRYFSGFKSSLPGMRAQAERMAINAPMQGTQSDIIKLAMVEADHMIEKEGWREKAKLVLQVHDELVYELDEHIAHEAASRIRKVMEHVAPEEELSGVPILAEIEIGKNWGEMEKLKRS